MTIKENHEHTKNADQGDAPIYPTLSQFPTIVAAYTGRGLSEANGHFSFHRPGKTDEKTKHQFNANHRVLMGALDAPPQAPTAMPNGNWPHTGVSIKAEDFTWTRHESCVGTVVPVGADGTCIVYDAIATRSRDFVLAAQGADCPSVFLLDPDAGIIGVAHAGWKPLVRGVLANVVADMVALGAAPARIHAFVGPGLGDRYNCFGWEDVSRMEGPVRDVFEKAGRADLLADETIRHKLTDAEQRELQQVMKGPVTKTSFCLGRLAAAQLVQAGLSKGNISCSDDSTIVSRWGNPGSYGDEPGEFKYHSYRRDWPNHGLNMSVIFLR